MKKISIIFITVVLLIGGCTKTPEKSPEPADNQTATEPAQKIMSFSLSGYEKNGKKKWEVEGKSADIMSDVVNLTDVIAKAYGAETAVTLTAEKGAFSRSTNDVHLESNVNITSSQGATMTTDELEWQNDEERAYTDKAVKVVAENLETTSTGAEARSGLQEIEFKKDVKVIGGEPKTTITCDGPMEFNYGKGYAEFNNKVKVVDGRGEMYCDKAIAYYDTNTRQVTKITAKGNVKIVRGGSWTFSDEAEYLAPEERIVLKGSPKVVIYPEQAKDVE